MRLRRASLPCMLWTHALSKSSNTSRPFSSPYLFTHLRKGKGREGGRDGGREAEGGREGEEEGGKERVREGISEIKGYGGKECHLSPLVERETLNLSII